jgi:hypothetical protein
VCCAIRSWQLECSTFTCGYVVELSWAGRQRSMTKRASSEHKGGTRQQQQLVYSIYQRKWVPTQLAQCIMFDGVGLFSSHNSNDFHHAALLLFLRSIRNIQMAHQGQARSPPPTRPPSSKRKPTPTFWFSLPNRQNATENYCTTLIPHAFQFLHVHQIFHQKKS